jgi:hypothetical protein
MGKALIILGFILIFVGFCWQYGQKLGLGRLPGDIYLKGDKYSFYFPIVSCLLLSALIAAILWLVQYFRH